MVLGPQGRLLWVPGDVLGRFCNLRDSGRGWWYRVLTKYVQILIWNYTATLIHTPARILALGPRFRQVLAPQRRLLRLPGVAIWEIFEILGELVIHSSHHVSTNPEIKPY